MAGTRLCAAAAAALLALATKPMPAVAAAACADRPVSARGDPSRFEPLAKAKARANWRARVRAMPTLGAAYADFNKAWAGHYRCSRADGRHTCIATGHPCRD